MGSGVDNALKGVEALYTGNLTEHGIASRSVGWNDEASQLLRFEKLALVLEQTPADRPVSINDYGCGYGAMFRWLDARAGPPIERYIGYDLSEEMLAAAREYAPDPRIELVRGADVSEEADFSFVSGTFNVKVDASDEDWSRYVRERLLQLSEKSRVGLAFNMLTTHVDWRKDDLFYADPAEFFDFAKRELGRYVTLVHGYPLWEWTMVVRHS